MPTPTELQSRTFHIDELDCPEELGVIEKRLGRLEGIGPLHPNYVAHTLRVEFDPARLDDETILARLRDVGFAVRREGEERPPQDWWTRRRRLVTTTIGGLLLAAATVAYFSEAPRTLVGGLLIASTVASGVLVALAGLRAARAGALDMNSLMTIAAVGAVAIGELSEAATAMFLFSVALGLESFSLQRARGAVRSLMELAPQQATRIVGDARETVPVEEIRVGDRLLVRPGEKIPVDGAVLGGESSVNQAPVTGESVPVDKVPGDEVFAGSLNGEGSLEVRASKAAAQSTLARIIHLVQEAQATRAPSQRFVDRFAHVYTPAVIVLAVLTAVVPPLAGTLGASWAGEFAWRDWIYRGLVLLVIACPCALVISTPVTVVCGLFQAARRGILIKGGIHLEGAGAVRAFVFDKTGTLSRGMLELVEVVPLDDGAPERLLALAAAVESHSEHPVALAIRTAARKRGIEPPAPSEFEALRGSGARATVDGQVAYVGKSRLFAELGVPHEEIERADQRLRAWPHTGVLVGTADALLGLLLLSDRPRPESRDAVAGLRRLGVERIAMLTGDNRRAADSIAGNVGVDEVYAELLPEEKVDKVRELSEAHGPVAMVGDGVNDAPALAAAAVGIAMGSAGSDTALETADVALMSDNLGRLPELVDLSRRTMRIIRQNVVFALAVKLLFLILTVAGLATMWMAVAADTGASLVVIFNGMRLWLGGLRV